MKELGELLLKEDLLPIIELDAKSKNLKVFEFTNEDIKEYFTPKHSKIEVLVVAKNRDCATWNLKNLRHSYLVKVE